ncbi:hypothetical protein [Culicoidibacter larvae]|uniref:Uncharacterized protein n=1 Tax=Culicoidibacter larvae TaxID=2579976 RepID=A0A5R8Q914_9FIRM|nr:hypothetical protein [Culicoidibacter larvae]TLG71294.1 hypothetical protein FEZ08_11125 [Culicoidibacter larvae]
MKLTLFLKNGNTYDFTDKEISYTYNDLGGTVSSANHIFTRVDNDKEKDIINLMTKYPKGSFIDKTQNSLRYIPFADVVKFEIK